MSKTIAITSPQHLSQILSSSRIVITDFWASWCGPCKAIAPLYEQLSTQLSRPGLITFTKVDTDAQKDIVSTYNISAMPTFVVFKAGREVKRVKGANPKELDKVVKDLAAEAGKVDEAGGSASAMSAGERWTGASVPRGYGDVSEAVEIQGLDFLNLDGEAGDKRAIFESGKPSSLAAGKQKEGGKKDWIESDTDEQLMLFIPFQSTIKLHSLHITSIPVEDDEEVSRPKSLKLYTNRSTVLGFDEADDTPSTQELEIKEADWDEKTHTAKVELRFVKFQNVSSVVIFVVDNAAGSEKTRIDRIRLFGETGEKRAMGKLEKIGDEQGE